MTTVKPDLLKKLTAKGIDATLLGAAEILAQHTEAVLAQLPPDLRGLRTVTPDDTSAVKNAAAHIIGMRRAARSAALSLGKGDASKGLGTGKPLSKAAPYEVSAAIQAFLFGARDHMDVLAQAGITDADLQTLRDFQASLGKVTSNKSERSTEQTNLVLELDVHVMALERWCQLYRARAELACIGDAIGRTTVLKPLPKSRKARPQAVEAPVPEPVPVPVPTPAVAAVVAPGTTEAPSEA